jgi:hypothetical protein
MTDRVKKITHRSYAGWSLDALIAEHQRLGISGSELQTYLDTHLDRTTRFCMVQMAIDAQASMTPAQATDTSTAIENFERDALGDRYGYTAELYAYGLPRNALRFSHVGALVAAVDNSGSHFFSADSLRAWHSRVSSTLYGHRFFITSERNGWGNPRVYTVRYVYASPDTKQLMVSTLGEFAEFATMAQAQAMARRAARVLPELVPATVAQIALVVADRRASYPELSVSEAIDDAINSVDPREITGWDELSLAYRAVLTYPTDAQRDARRV